MRINIRESKKEIVKMSLFIAAIILLPLSRSQTISLLEAQTTRSCRYTVSVTNLPQSNPFSCLQQSRVQSSLSPPSRGKVSVSFFHCSIHPHSPRSALFTLSNNPPGSTESPGHSFSPGAKQKTPCHTAAVTLWFLSTHCVKNRQLDDFLQQLKDTCSAE